MTQALLRVWRRTVRRLGYCGPIALVVVLASAAIAVWLPRLDKDLQLTRVDREARATLLRTRGSQPLREPSRDERLLQYVEAFPLQGQMAADLGEIYASAERNNVVLLKGEYQLKAEPNSPFAAYVVTLPIHAGYGPLKAFAGSVLQALPHASLDELRLNREGTEIEVLDAVVRFTLTYRSR